MWCHLAGGRRDPRVLRVDGGRGERRESQKVFIGKRQLSMRASFVFVFVFVFLVREIDFV